MVALACSAQAGLESMAACGASSATLRSRTCAPACSASPAMALAIVETVPVEE